MVLYLFPFFTMLNFLFEMSWQDAAALFSLCLESRCIMLEKPVTFSFRETRGFLTT